MLISGLFILLLVSAISQERINGVILNRAAALVLFYSFILSLSVSLDTSIIGSGIGVFGGLYQITVVSKTVECFIYLLGAMILSNTLLVTKDRLDHSLTIKAESSIIALFTVVGGVLLITSNDLISMYLSIELQSFGLYVLATIYRDSQSATDAGLKYFLLGGLSSGFILLGSSLIYADLGVTNLESISLLINLDDNVNKKFFELSGSFFLLESLKYVEIGMLIMIIGFLFKIASAPFHNWAPDVYDGVPTKITTWLAIMGKISILTFLLDLVIGSRSSIDNNLESISSSFLNYSSGITASSLILIAALLSLLIGTIVGLAQSRIKRLLAYSTISHVGFLLLALAINSEDSIESFIFYLIQYSLTSANAFFVLIALGSSSILLKKEQKKLETNNDKIKSQEEEYSPIIFISSLAGIFNRSNSASSLLALTMAVILFSMAGIPPLVGFFAKQMVLLSAVKNGFVFLALIGIITSVISAAYYLRIIKVMLFDKPLSDLDVKFNNKSHLNSSLNLEVKEQDSSSIINKENPSPALSQSYNGGMTMSLSFSISILTVLILFFVLKPSLILNSAHLMALSLFYL
jgi:NADH-ubiquinone oxidoreductase chain 2